MRVAIALLLTVAGCACSNPTRGQAVESVELRASGLDVSINSRGQGRYTSSRSARSQASGTFDIGPAQFDRLLDRLSAYRQQSGPTGKTSRAFLASSCLKNLPYVTDAGMISIRWSGSALDQIYIVDLGCDYQRNTKRNRELASILGSLPVPEPAPLP